jgi:predicted RNA-binding Zn ribbon-like protein
MSALYEAGPQSGGRVPAPGRLAYVQAFANSFFDLGEGWGKDRFATPASLQRWFSERGLQVGRVTDAEHARALAVRGGLRAQFAEHNGTTPDPVARQRLRDAIAGLPAAYALDDDGTLAPDPDVTGVAGALGLLVAIVHESQLAGTWTRLKACPGHHCGWVFYDVSRNAASTWCSMQVCGSREKARAYRRRVRGAS